MNTYRDCVKSNETKFLKNMHWRHRNKQLIIKFFKISPLEEDTLLPTSCQRLEGLLKVLEAARWCHLTPRLKSRDGVLWGLSSLGWKGKCSLEPDPNFREAGESLRCQSGLGTRWDWSRFCFGALSWCSLKLATMLGLTRLTLPFNRFSSTHYSQITHCPSFCSWTCVLRGVCLLHFDDHLSSTYAISKQQLYIGFYSRTHSVS